ncbi:RDD family protein [Actinomyces naeslundii]|uniref:RDD family protein n=1 Tax=Actinomyces naeslundii TaxID=1655 RepID=UPI00241F7951|nr:RDD family protein [Actinomyces naeslundii]
MTVTADPRSSAPTAAGPPTSSYSSSDSSGAEAISPYGVALSDSPDRGRTGEARRSGGTESSASPEDRPHPPRRRLPPAPVRARVVAGAIDLLAGSLLFGGLTALIWQVAGRPAMFSGLIAFGVVVGLRWLAIAATGWSLGGLLLRIRMLGARNQTPSPLGSFLHADLILAVSITTLGLGTVALMRTAAADPEGRGWHDKLSGMALLHTRKTKRPDRPTISAAEPGGRPTSEPASRAAVRSAAPEGSFTQDAGEAWDAAKRAAFSAPRSEQSAAGQEPTTPPSSKAAEAQDESPSRRRRSERAERKAEKKAGKAAKRSSREGSARSRAGDQVPQEGAETTTVGAQSATEAGIMTSPGGTAYPTTSDPVSSSIRRPRPARPGQPARHAGRALTTGSPSSATSQTASATAAAYTAAVSGKAASADGYGVIRAPKVVKAAKAATVSSSSAASAASASPAVSETDAAAVAAASATPMDPQASAALAAAEASAMSAEQRQSTRSAQSAPSATSATAPAQKAVEKSATSRTSTSTEPPAKPAGAPSGAGRPSSKQSSQMDAETATLDAVEDTPEPSESTDQSEPSSTHGPPSEATTPSAESSKTAADSEASQASTSQDATPSTQVPRSKATKPVTSQTMEPRHAHAQRWRIQSGLTGKKTSASSAAPTEDQREPASQPGVPRRESLFTPERHHFASGAASAPEVAHTFDTSSILPSGDRNTQALIDSVPWSSVPTSVDAATVDSLPEGVIVTDDDSSRKPEEAEVSSPRAAQMDLTNPSTVPGGVPASSEGQAHPTVRSHRSHAQAPVSSGSTSATATEETPSRRPHTTHRFQGPGIPAPAEEAEAPASRRERRDAAQAPAGSRTSSAASTSRRSGARTGDRTAGVAGSLTNAAAPTSAPAAASHPTAASVPAVSAQAATPSLPSASSASPALSVRLVPLLGGNPILIHEPTVVGRDPDNISAYPGAERVALDDPTRSVSKTHAAIFPLLDGVWVTDLHSTNGTRVEYRDGRSVEAVPDKALSALEGSTIFFGRIAFKVEVV